MTTNIVIVMRLELYAVRIMKMSCYWLSSVCVLNYLLTLRMAAICLSSWTSQLCLSRYCVQQLHCFAAIAKVYLQIVNGLETCIWENLLSWHQEKLYICLKSSGMSHCIRGQVVLIFRRTGAFMLTLDDEGALLLKGQELLIQWHIVTTHKTWILNSVRTSFLTTINVSLEFTWRHTVFLEARDIKMYWMMVISCTVSVTNFWCLLI
jgi:hypothetical protein